MVCKNVMRLVFLNILLIFPLRAFQEEYPSSSTPDFTSLLSPSLGSLFDDMPSTQERHNENELWLNNCTSQKDDNFAHALQTSANLLESNNLTHISPQSDDYEKFKKATIRLLTHGYHIISLKKSIFALDEKKHPGICVDVIDTIQRHALSLTNQADRANFEVMITLLKLNALEKGVTLAHDDHRDQCKDTQMCESQLHTQALNISSPVADSFFANDDFAFNELLLGIKHGMFHEKMIERLANRFVHQQFRNCMKCIDKHVIDTQKKQALVSYYPKIQLNAQYSQNRRIISSKLHTWATAIPHFVNSELIQLLDKDRQTNYQNSDACNTCIVVNAIDEHESDELFTPNQALNNNSDSNPVTTILHNMSGFAFTHSPQELHALLLGQLEDYPPKVAHYIRSVLCFKQQPQLLSMPTHTSPSAYHTSSAHNSAHVDLTYESELESSSENSQSEDYSEETSCDSYEEDEEKHHYNTNSPLHLSSSIALPNQLSKLLLSKKFSIKKLARSVTGGTFHESIIVEAAIRATSYPAFCEFVQTVSNNICHEEFAASCAYYQRYVTAVKSNLITPIQIEKVATRLHNFHASKYEQLKPKTPRTYEHEMSSRKRKKHSAEYTFIYENGAVTDDTK